jgi:hypothetical protein
MTARIFPVIHTCLLLAVVVGQPVSFMGVALLGAIIIMLGACTWES